MNRWIHGLSFTPLFICLLVCLFVWHCWFIRKRNSLGHLRLWSLFLSRALCLWGLHALSMSSGFPLHFLVSPQKPKYTLLPGSITVCYCSCECVEPRPRCYVNLCLLGQADCDPAIMKNRGIYSSWFATFVSAFLAGFESSLLQGVHTSEVIQNPTLDCGGKPYSLREIPHKHVNY